MDQSARFLELILAHRKGRVEASDLLGYFDACFPEFRFAPDREARCRKKLDTFDGRTVTLSTDARKKGRQTAMPRFVAKINAPAAPLPAGRSDDWLPDLAELASTLRGGRLDALRQINAFLKDHPGPLPLIPYRERSLQIFGDEKRIGNEGLRLTNGTLFEGRLPLARIGANDPPLPFPFIMPSTPCPGRPILVVENHHSYASFVAANDRNPTFAAIVWGHGNAFTKGYAEHIDEISNRSRASEVLYLGDLDPDGVLIPHGADAARRKAGLPPVQPATQLYKWLLDNGTRRALPSVSDAACAAAMSWLGEELGRRVVDLWREGFWIPQESLSGGLIAGAVSSSENYVVVARSL